jgi:hypothetical protein
VLLALAQAQVQITCEGLGERERVEDAALRQELIEDALRLGALPS